MAVTKIHPIKSTLAKALDYIKDPAKTDGKLLVSSFACSYETADIEFQFTLSKALDKGNNLAHHLIQSFEPGETTPEQAHEIGKRLADEVLQGRHEYVLTTHIDKGHIHNPLIFCAARFTDYHKYESNKKSYSQIRRTSDELCKEYDLSVVKPGKNKGKHYAEHAADKTGGGSWKSKLRVAIDMTIPQSSDFNDFLRRMEEVGYEVKPGKHISFRAPGQERFTRAKTLGEDYTEEAITGRISGEYARVPRSVRTVAQSKAAPSLIIDIENSIKAQQGAGYAHWAKIKNLKEAAKTLNFLTENGLLHYADLEAKAAEVTAALNDAAASLKATDRKLSDMAVLIKHREVYRQTKPAADGLKVAKDKDIYRREHESALILHTAAAKALRKLRTGGGKAVPLATLKADHAKLTKRRDSLKAEYARLREQAREYGVVKANVESILSGEAGRTRGRGRENELS
jgi:hypothetical protein